MVIKYIVKCCQVSLSNGHGSIFIIFVLNFGWKMYKLILHNLNNAVMLRTLHTKLVICITSMFLVVLNSNLKQSSTFSVSDLVKWHWVQSLYGPGHAKMCLMAYATNKGADQPAYPRSLISAFVVRSLDSIIFLVSRSEISRF